MARVGTLCRVTALCSWGQHSAVEWVGTEIGGGKARWPRRVDGEGDVAQQPQVQVAVPLCPLP